MAEKEKLFEVIHKPNSRFTGRRQGVQFKDGKAKCAEKKALMFGVQYGYDVPEMRDDIERIRKAIASSRRNRKTIWEIYQEGKVKQEKKHEGVKS